MSKDEEELPLYHVEDSDKEVNYYSSKTKYRYKSKKKLAKDRYYKKTKYQINNDMQDHDNKKFESLKKLYFSNKIISSIKNFFCILFNSKHPKVIYLFFLLILSELIEYFIDTYINFFPVKFSMSILFLIPYIIITLENEIFFQVNSIFELNFIVNLKLIIMFNKNMNFYEIIILTLCATLFESVFIKKMHVSQYYYTLDGIVNKITYKVYVFESEINLIICGFVCNIVFLLYLLKNKKLCFYIFDDIFIGIGDNFHAIYFFLIEYLFLRKFIKYLFKYNFVYTENNKRKEKTVLINVLFFVFVSLQLILINLFDCSFSQKILNILIIGLIIFLYENIGFLLFINMILMSLVIYVVNHIVKKYFSTEIIMLIKRNLIYINISFLLTLIFIITIFMLEKKQITNFYTLIYQRIFLIKIIFDIWLVVKYIYSLYKYDPLNYFNIYLETYKFFFLSFLINYFIVLIALLIKIYIYIDPVDVEYYFEDIIQFLNNKKVEGEVFYGGSAPYVEIKLYKSISNICGFLKNDIFKSDKKTKAFMKILYSVILSIFAILCFIINNTLLYFPIFFVLIQFFSNILDDIVFLILNQFSSIIYVILEKAQELTFDDKFKRYQEDHMIQQYKEKMRKKQMTIYIKKEKLKLIYLLLFFYISILWKKIFSHLFIIIYEKIISYWQYKLFGKLEPLGNIIYQIIIINYYAEEENKYFNIEIFFLFIFLLPNSLAIIFSHYTGKITNFFFQNYILTSLLPLFFNMDIIIILLGFFNILLMISIFACDDESYKNFKYWFFLFGIQQTSYRY